MSGSLNCSAQCFSILAICCRWVREFCGKSRTELQLSWCLSHHIIFARRVVIYFCHSVLCRLWEWEAASTVEKNDYDTVLFKDWSCIPFRMFLEAGKHVLVEYPMALSAKAAHELWEMAEQKGNGIWSQGCKQHYLQGSTNGIKPKGRTFQSAITHDMQRSMPISEMCQSRI